MVESLPDENQTKHPTADPPRAGLMPWMAGFVGGTVHVYGADDTASVRGGFCQPLPARRRCISSCSEEPFGWRMNSSPLGFAMLIRRTTVPRGLAAVQRTADGQVRVHFKKLNRLGAT